MFGTVYIGVISPLLGVILSINNPQKQLVSFCWGTALMLSRVLLDMEVSCLEALRAVELGLAGGFSDELGMAGTVLRQVCGCTWMYQQFIWLGLCLRGNHNENWLVASKSSYIFHRWGSILTFIFGAWKHQPGLSLRMYMDVPTVYMIGVMFEGQSQWELAGGFQKFLHFS